MPELGGFRSQTQHISSLGEKLNTELMLMQYMYLGRDGSHKKTASERLVEKDDETEKQAYSASVKELL